MLITSHALFHLIIVTTTGRFYYDSSLTVEGTDVATSEVYITHGHTGS